MSALSAAMPLHGFPAPPYVSFRACEGQGALSSLELQGSVGGMWTAGSFSLTLSPHWDASPGSQPIPVKHAPSLLFPSFLVFFLTLVLS